MSASFESTNLLRGDVGVVTGAARGNGEAIARGLARHGATVAVADLDVELASTVAKEIVEAGGQAAAYHLDVSDESSCNRVAAEVADQLGRVSVLVNNAGILMRAQPGADNYVATVRRQFEVNLLGTALMVHVCVDDLKATRGRILNVGSTASFRAAPSGSGYAASKGGVLQLTKTLAVDLAPFGIRVNAIAPSMFKTQMSAEMWQNDEIRAKLIARTPLSRFGDPEDLVGPAVFLLSEMSAYVTGSMLAVDGGLLTG
jgi:NAD(P)-dependent dehydrogenase (short-subunit alcohol dehydrogenase family)